jgi:hypothetical protein
MDLVLVFVMVDVEGSTDEELVFLVIVVVAEAVSLGADESAVAPEVDSYYFFTVVDSFTT